MCSPKWPEYYTGLDEQLHALGVVAAVFNRLEHNLLGLFLAYLGFNDGSTFLFARLRDNRTRIDLLLKYVEFRGETDEIKEAINYFCTCFNSAAENRNILMHSGISNVYEDGEVTHLIFSKGKKQDAIDWNRYVLDLKRLRQVADEIKAVEVFGRGLYQYVTSHYHPELQNEPVPPPVNAPFPDKPAQPNILSPQDLPAAIIDSARTAS